MSVTWGGATGVDDSEGQREPGRGDVGMVGYIQARDEEQLLAGIEPAVWGFCSGRVTRTVSCWSPCYDHDVRTYTSSCVTSVVFRD